MTDHEDFATCTLTDGVPARVDVGDLLTVTVGGAVVAFPYPDRGLAWVDLSGSPSGRYVVLQHSSGQGEESYRVLDRNARFETVAKAEYVYGEGNTVGFSDGERLFVAAIPTVCFNWWDLFDEPAEVDVAGRAFVEVGRVLVHDIRARTRASTSLRVWTEDDWSEHRQPYASELRPSFAESALELDMPWGKEVLAFPVRDVVWFRPPAESGSAS